jgi:hypothetical protein
VDISAKRKFLNNCRKQLSGPVAQPVRASL